MSQKNLSKKVAYKARSRNWTDNEFEEFAKILADDENAFAISLDKLALEKSANNEVFSQIKIAFDRALRDPDFKKKSEERYRASSSIALEQHSYKENSRCTS